MALVCSFQDNGQQGFDRRRFSMETCIFLNVVQAHLMLMALHAQELEDS